MFPQRNRESLSPVKKIFEILPFQTQSNSADHKFANSYVKAFSLTSKGVLHIQFILFVIRMSKRNALFGEHLSLFYLSKSPTK